MAELIKRVHYFDHQFLHENDFTDEQAYHMGMRREHNRRLHTWGVAYGLGLTFPAGATRVTVGEGMAIDGLGREIVLAEATQTPDLSSFAGGTAFVVIVYDEEETDSTTETGVTGNTRWTERPAIEVSATPPADASLALILGRVTVDGTGTVTSVDDGVGPNRRRSAGVAGGDMEVTSLTLANPTIVPAQWASMRLTSSRRAELDGNLRVNGNIGLEGTLTGTLGPGMVGASQIANNAVTADKIADGSIGTNELANGAVTAAKIAVNSITGDRIADGSVGTNELANDSVTGPKIAPNAVTADKIVDGSIGTNELANSAVSGTKIAANAVTADKIVDGSIGTNELADRAVTGIKIAQNALSAQDVGALPAAGGAIEGWLSCGGNPGNGGASALFRSWSNNMAVSISGGTSFAYPGITGGLGVWAYTGDYGIFVHQSDSAKHALYINQGLVRFPGGKSAYVVDKFVNGSGEILHTGDVVVLKASTITRFEGDLNRIPIPVVTLTTKANNPAVIGVVDREAVPGPEETDRRTTPEDPTSIPDDGDLMVVTLGTYSHCKVDATEAPIEVGDLLTTSANPGHARKATEPRLGSIIGKALEPLQEGTGYIAVFVNIQ